MTPLLTTLLAIALEASEVIREVYSAPFDVDFKSPGDPVTAADRRANELIVRRLREAYPTVPIVAEESDPRTFANYRSAERVFFVDPLDGTREFVARNGEFVVMIGVLDDARPSHGVIASPVSGTVWLGDVAHGAVEWRDGEEHAAEVSSVATLAEARLVVSRSHQDRVVERAQSAFGAGRVDRVGSAGLKGAEVARGHAEAYVAPFMAGKRWDACAPEAIVTAAGGRVTNARGVPLDYRDRTLDNDGGIIVSNGAVHDEIVARLAELMHRLA